MDIVTGAAATIAILCVAVIFGTDVLAGVVLKSVYADVDDRTMVQAVGRGHYYGDKRLPVVGILSVVLTVVTVLLAFVWGTTLGGILAALALAMLLIWLLLFARISAPINKRLTAAAFADEVPADARALQARWESIIPLRATLQGLAIALLCAAIILG
ncbi:DUF1772 domain-containing protein [Microbacterium candidum]|uniref:DUF1772 domain-containing protein n=1 Tax=Microbacterium candidum TaxID=3041922 RepID=A0ABT7N3R1_9MICO|nr:DUF1772 domain-containing protein [Microbacterium sp. ASV49]MDL9981340.1 DUF1772 domain-containing protein [Microbacterium sp. ASV49]